MNGTERRERAKKVAATRSRQNWAREKFERERQAEADIHDEAVAIVDGRYGYAIEFTADAEDRRAEYEEEKSRLRRERREEEEGR